MIDGCSRLGALWRVILPLTGPGLVAVAMFTFITTWNDFLFAFMLISRTRYQTLSVGLSFLFESADATAWGPLMAGSVVTFLPVFIIFLLLQKYLVGGLTAGAVKG